MRSIWPWTPPLGELQRPLLGILEAEGGLGVGRREGRRRGGLVGEEGKNQPLDSTERSGGVRDLPGQPLLAHLRDQLPRRLPPLAKRLRRWAPARRWRVLVERLEDLVSNRPAGQRLGLGPDPAAASARAG